jgi:hypothetical protein
MLGSGMTRRSSHDLAQLKRYLHRLQLQQTQDVKLLRDYERKHIPSDASFIVMKRNEIRYRDDRIASLIGRIRSLEQ